VDKERVLQELRMQMAKDKPAIEETPAGAPIEANAQSATKRLDAAMASLRDLREASEVLKAKIANAKRRNDIPLDPALGSPDFEQNAADGALDVPDKDDD
jgi:hypothetical protein